MKKLSSFLKPYWLLIILALSLMIVELGVELLQPLFIAKIIDDGILQKDLSVVIKWGSVMVGLSVFSFLGGIVNSFTASHVSQSFGHDVRTSLFGKIQAFSFANLNNIPTSSLITRMTNDVTQLQNTVFMGLRIMARAPLIVIGGAIMAIAVDLKLSLVLVISIPVLVFFLGWVMKRAAKLFKLVQKKLDNVNGVMRENLIGMRLIKAFLRKEHEIGRFDDANEELKRKTVSSLRLIETTMPVLMLVMNVVILIILWLGSEFITTGDIQVGEVVAIVNYATRIAASLSVFSWLIMVISRAKASAERVTEIFETSIDIDEGKAESKSGAVNGGGIKFLDVSFRYPGTETPILKNLTFSIDPGESLAIIGATGSGKTSLFQLIPRLYEVESGSIQIDGQDLKDIPLNSLRNRIGYVPQEALLFSGTIKNNVAWGKEGASMEEIMAAAMHAQVHETVMKLPKQYETQLGQKGVNLSGGQKQRLSIARALVRKPKILLLDDSTSALDLKTESKLLAALKDYTCTTLIITQKISTAMEADKILLLESGQVLALGKHQDLMQTSDLYRKIVRSQFGEEGISLESKNISR
ncbi:ABC transporter ATP-binding protein [Peribacillus frigoritolerans]|uniref:ABC transporter ATP-binding protein n=1 Tax=Peribacillus frigoritolerans TaxID=450367 RepID=UPI00177D23B3|nr:ABC transporter ATP-binding protein [Peribacillus frigoritolerans]MBD8136757.1 ABC transporter ATP-binding protein [Bacillus sp. CFBP 13597]MED3833909.1 ABC transporter ATP-binding protein [Peribacillus frigoritolerans]MED3847191.1 ABC transporter ATP-binding protein [Peribacillus frigoritolerans]WVN11626.1 ABC transporter ATP-binding protein [Peribacillus frigoritolerans]